MGFWGWEIGMHGLYMLYSVLSTINSCSVKISCIHKYSSSLCLNYSNKLLGSNSCNISIQSWKILSAVDSLTPKYILSIWNMGYGCE